MRRVKNIKACPVCGRATSRTAITVLDEYESVESLCARCHHGVVKLYKDDRNKVRKYLFRWSPIGIPLWRKEQA